MSIRVLPLLLTLCLGGCERSNHESNVEVPTATKLEADLRRVAIEACLNRYYSKPGSTILVRTPTSTHGFLDFEDDKDKESFIYQVCQPGLGIGLLERATAEDFIAANQEPVTLGIEDFGGVDWIEVITEDECRSYWSGADSTEEAWAALLQKHPKAVAVVDISLFGWNSERSEGLLYVGSLSNPGVGEGGFYALRRHGSQYSCDHLIGAPTWITKADKTRLDHPLGDPALTSPWFGFSNSLRLRASAGGRW